MQKQKTHSEFTVLISWLRTLILLTVSIISIQALAIENNDVIQLMVKPSLTDSSITQSDNPHLILYRPTAVNKSENKLLIFLPGTNGIPERGPRDLFNAAIEKGRSVINLGYITKQAVAGICKGENLEQDEYCTSKFRTKRIFGEGSFSLIPDQPQDAILNRLTKLLVYLTKTDKAGKWGRFLIQGKPNWSEIILTGQSQGGGMAAFIAQRVNVYKVITFSGGWDYSSKGKIAHWYSNPSVTPAERRYATYNVKEPAAKVLEQTYKALGVPESQTFALDEKVRAGKKAHSDAIRNTIYKPMWLDIL